VFDMMMGPWKEGVGRRLGECCEVTGEPEDEHADGCSETQPAKITTSESDRVLWLQRHIRQHMPTQPGIIIPVVPFASWADKGRALVVMGPIITDGDHLCQNGPGRTMRA